MATIQFPTDGLSDGYTFTAENGVIYTYDSSGGGGWTANNPEGLDDRYVEITGDTMTGDLNVTGANVVVDGDISATGNAVVTGDVQSTSQNGGQLAGLRNQIINGDFKVWARGTAVSIPDSTVTYTADRWAGNTSSGTSQIARSVNSPNVEGLIWSATNTGSVLVAFQQAIELYNQSNCQFTVGSQWTLSFWTTEDQTANLANVKFKAGTTDNGSDASNSFPLYQATGKTSNGYTQYSATFTITTDTSTVANCNCLSVIFNLLPGQSIAGVQLEPGSVVTPFESRPLALELALCQRYFVRLNEDFAIWSGYAAAGSGYATTGTYPVEMRAVPTVSNVTSWQRTASVFSQDNIQPFAFKQSIYFSCSATGSANSAFFYAGADCNAEL